MTAFFFIFYQTQDEKSSKVRSQSAASMKYFTTAGPRDAHSLPLDRRVF